MANYDLASLVLKSCCPGNTLLMDDKGIPSVMTYVPKFKISDVIAGASNSTHPAFIVNGKEIPGIYISKYQNIIQNGRAYSLPFEDPGNSITFDTARAACEAKGKGWHIMSNAEWAAIALWCRKNNTIPSGNNTYGKDATETLYRAVPTLIDTASGNTFRVATGTGPLEWSHDRTLSGIWDLNGNVYEWQAGYRTVDGEIQVIPNNDAAAGVDQSVTSTFWRAIMPDGSLVLPGTAGTLKWDYTADPGTVAAAKPFQLATALAHPQTNDIPYGAATFSALTSVAGLTAPEILKALALFPADAGEHGGDQFYMRNIGERFAYRGGGWGDGAGAGVFSLHGGNSRASASTPFGFRSAYAEI